jgi:hypothetical protein
MSQRSSAETAGVYVRKPKVDVYTFMLLVALVALILGIWMLCLEMERYKWEFRRPTVTPPAGGAATLIVESPTALV